LITFGTGLSNNQKKQLKQFVIDTLNHQAMTPWPIIYFSQLCGLVLSKSFTKSLLEDTLDISLQSIEYILPKIKSLPIVDYYHGLYCLKKVIGFCFKSWLRNLNLSHIFDIG